jgi:hypothetical protein
MLEAFNRGDQNVFNFVRIKTYYLLILGNEDHFKPSDAVSNISEHQNDRSAQTDVIPFFMQRELHKRFPEFLVSRVC